MEEKKSGDREKGLRKKVSATWGLKGGPLATVASPLVPQGPPGILQTHQAFGENASEGHRGAGDPPDLNCEQRMLRQLACLHHLLDQVLSPGGSSHSVYFLPGSHPQLFVPSLWPTSRITLPTS